MAGNEEPDTVISPDEPVREILRRHPESKHLFRSYGFDEFFDASGKSGEMAFVTLRETLRVRNIDCDGFVAVLAEHIAAHRTSGPETLASRSYNQRDLQFLALMPCPVKIPFHGAFSEFLMHEWDGNPPFRYLIESNANNQLEYYRHVDVFNHIDDMPDLVISPGLNGYYYRRFFEKFREKKYFTDVMNGAGSPYRNLDLCDPDHHYSMLGANIEVLVIDNARLGDRNVPERWSDLLRPEYRNTVSVRGQDGFFCETVLLTMYRQVGLSGVRDLARAVRAAVHPSQMVKNAGSRKVDAPPISIMPLFFANLAKNIKDVTIVWPEEGAIVSPVTLIAKRERREELEPLVSFLAGKKTGELFSGVWFPSMACGVPPCVPRDAVFDWIGWDYLNSHDLGKEISGVTREFSSIYYGKVQ